MDLLYEFMIFTKSCAPLITFSSLFAISFLFFSAVTTSVFHFRLLGYRNGRGGIKSNLCRRDYAITRVTVRHILRRCTARHLNDMTNGLRHLMFPTSFASPATTLRENIKSPLFAANAFHGRIWFPALPGLYRTVGRVTPSLRGRNRNCSLSVRYWTMARRIGLKPKWCHTQSNNVVATHGKYYASANGRYNWTVHQFDHRDKCAFIGDFGREPSNLASFSAEGS